MKMVTTANSHTQTHSDTLTFSYTCTDICAQFRMTNFGNFALFVVYQTMEKSRNSLKFVVSIEKLPVCLN